MTLAPVMGTQLLAFPGRDPTDYICLHRGIVRLLYSYLISYFYLSAKFSFRFHLEHGMIHPDFIPTTEMIADCLTKSVPAPKVRFCREQMGVLA